MSDHILVVFQLGDDPDQFEQSEVEHPTGCRFDPTSGDYDCSVSWVGQSTGFRSALDYSGTPVISPGRYPVVFWAETIRGFDWTEHDASIAVVGDRADLTPEDLSRIGE